VIPYFPDIPSDIPFAIISLFPTVVIKTPKVQFHQYWNPLLDTIHSRIRLRSSNPVWTEFLLRT